MTLREYFQTTHGTGVLSTADSKGAVDAAVYSKPHVFNDGTIGFIMRKRLTHHNLQSNPFAAYLFIEEEGAGYRGVRLFLKKIREETDSAAIDSLMMRRLSPEEELKKGPKYLVTFAVERILPLTSYGEMKVVSIV